MKQRLRWAMDAIADSFSGLQVRRFRRRHNGAVTVLDIDNTLADAWPSFLAGHRSERERLRDLELLPGMKVAAYDGRDRVLFLSHRSWWYWWLTRRWLRENGFDGTLVLVSTPGHKLGHLRRLVDGGGQVVYWDDLSHGTERGRTELYVELIDAVGALDLTYHGIDEIEAVVAAAGGRRSGSGRGSLS